MSEEMYQQRELEKELGIHEESQEQETFELYDLSEYTGELETHYWVPDKSKPQRKVRLDLRIHAIRQSDRNVIQRKINDVGNNPGQINFYNKQLEQLQAPYEREMDKLNERLRNVSKFDEEFDGDEEKADQKRAEIERQIAAKTKEHKENRAGLEAKVQALLAAPSMYEIWRADLFSQVIHEHNISLPVKGVLTKIDFDSSHPDHELPFHFARALQEFIWEVLNRGKQNRKNGSSQRR